MRIKLISPPSYYKYSLSVTKRVSLPYGLGILTEYLRRNNISVNMEDLNAQLNSPHRYSDSKDILRKIIKFYHNQVSAGYYTGITDKRNNSVSEILINLIDVRGYDLVGLGIMSYTQILTALLLAEKIKKVYRIPVVIGGAYVTAFADLFFHKYDFIDYAIVGDGEIPLLELIHSINGENSIKKVPSLWFRYSTRTMFNGRTFFHIENQSRPNFEDLFLDLYDIDTKAKPKKLHIPYTITRGCIYGCSFCIYPLIDGPWQCKSIGKVVKDIGILKYKYGINYFRFEDTNFNISYEYVEKLCDEFIKNKVNITWLARVKPINIDERLINKMSNAGCQFLLWGFESGSNRILQSMKKATDVKSQIKVLRMAKKAGITNIVHLVVKYPYESRDDLEQTVSFVKENAHIIDGIDIYKLNIYHKSFLYNNAGQIRIKIKQNKSTFITYAYDFKEIDTQISKQYQQSLERTRNRISHYATKYVNYKYSNFPFNIVARILGRKIHILRFFRN